MNFDPYTQEPIHAHGIWRATQCLAKEHSVMEHFRVQLSGLGWQCEDDHGKFWRRGDQRVIVVLVDDVRSTHSDKSIDLPYLHDADTTIITDTRINCPTMYRVWRLPDSFFGIYHTDAAAPAWHPERDYVFSINRLDTMRMKLFLELAKRVHLRHGWVNFNGLSRFHGNQFDPTDLPQANFEAQWQSLGDEDREQWRASHRLLSMMMPVKNYDIAHHDIYHRGHNVIECETYAGDNSIAFSEKIFRLLTQPVPWNCYAGRYGMAWLRSMGFDIVDDVMDHAHFDGLKETENKCRIFIWKSLSNIQLIKSQDQERITQRFQKACDHNRNLLSGMAQRWPQEFQSWCDHYLDQLS